MIPSDEYCQACLDLANAILTGGHAEVVDEGGVVLARFPLTARTGKTFSVSWDVTLNFWVATYLDVPLTANGLVTGTADYVQVCKTNGNFVWAWDTVGGEAVVNPIDITAGRPVNILKLQGYFKKLLPVV